MGSGRRSGFDRVANGYDPAQVAAFAAEALEWKREMLELRARVDLLETALAMDEDAHAEAEAIVTAAEAEAARIIEDARQVAAMVDATPPEDAFLRVSPGTRDDDVETTVDEPAADDTSQPVADPDEAVSRTDEFLPPTPEMAESPAAASTLPDEPTAEVAEPLEEEEELSEREQMIAAAVANLWKRRGVITPPD